MDQLYKKLNRNPAERLALLEQHADLVSQRDDLTIERISLLNLLGRHAEAFDLLMARNFHPWEGGEGKVTGQYVVCLVEKAKRHLANQQPKLAIDCLEKAQIYPPNLGEGKLYGAQENQIFYWLGCANEMAQRLKPESTISQSPNLFEKAAVGLSEPPSASFYNDQPPRMIC